MTHPIPWEGPPPHEVCVVMLSAVGDAVHVLPVVNALKRAWPGTRITWVIQPVPHALVRGHPSVDDFVVFRRGRGLEGIRAFGEFRHAVAGRRFDLLLGLQVYLKAGILTALTPARVKLGFDRARARDGQWIFTTHRVPPHPPQHVQDQYLEFLTCLGVASEPVTWGLSLTEQEEEASAGFFATLDGPALAVVVGTSDPRKNWTAQGYARVLEEARRRHGLHPVLVGGPSPTERRMADEIARSTSAPVVDALGDDIRRVLWLLRGSALTLSADTGPLHVSRAVDTPVVGIYGHTNPLRTGPYRKFQELVVDGYAERPGEPYPLTHARRDGMKRVTVDMVVEKLDLAVARYVG